MHFTVITFINVLYNAQYYYATNGLNISIRGVSMCTTLIANFVKIVVKSSYQPLKGIQAQSELI